MLIVVKHGNVQRLTQLLLDIKTIGCFDVFKINAAKSGFEQLYHLYDIIWVGRPDLEIENIDVSKALEQHGLAFHNRLGRHGPDVAEAEHGGTIGDDRYEVPLDRIIKDILRIITDFQARYRYARAIGQRQVPLRSARFGWADLDLSTPSAGVILKGVVLTNYHSVASYLYRSRLFFWVMLLILGGLAAGDKRPILIASHADIGDDSGNK